jgi:rhodanese-related sulfurtransferase
VPIWILDTRTSAQYNRGHIPKAKNVPYNLGTGKIDFDKVPEDIYLILYCETGGRAQEAAKALVAEGYSKYMVWGGVTTDWPYDLVTD